MSSPEAEAARDIHLLDQELAANEEWFRGVLASAGFLPLESMTITEEGGWIW